MVQVNVVTSRCLWAPARNESSRNRVRALARVEHHHMLERLRFCRDLERWCPSHGV